MEKVAELIKELLENGLSKILAIIVIPILPILALFGNFNATGNYFLDLLIALGITGSFVFLIWLKVKK